MNEFHTVEEAIQDIKDGKMIIIIDDKSRENEGDIVVAAEHATPEVINFMVKYARGIVCTPMLAEDLDRLAIPLMVQKNTDNHQTGFTVTIDHVDCGTGVSPFERSLTIRSLLDPKTKPEDLRRPGHVFPLRYADGGVLKRRGHTEASVDITKLAGCYPASVICEITNDDGTMAVLDDLIAFAQEHQLKMISVNDLVNYRKQHECSISLSATAQLPTKFGDFTIHVYQDEYDDNKEHIALIKGDVTNKDDVMVRIHSECATGDLFGSKRCDCGEQLESALEQIEAAGLGVLLYMRQEGRGIGLVNKIKAYALQEQGLDTVEANEELGFKPDLREYNLSAKILKQLAINSIQLVTNNSDKINELKYYGIKINQRIPTIVKSNPWNEKYLTTKKDKMNHLLNN